MNIESQDTLAGKLHKDALRRCGLYDHHDNSFRDKASWTDQYDLSIEERQSLNDALLELDAEHIHELLDRLTHDLDSLKKRFRIYYWGGDLVILATLLIAFFIRENAGIWILALYLFGGYAILIGRMDPWREQVTRLKQFVKQTQKAATRRPAAPREDN